jgi:hypothetical protein
LQNTRSNQEPALGRLRLAELLAALSVVTDLGSWRAGTIQDLPPGGEPVERGAGALIDLGRLPDRLVQA